MSAEKPGRPPAEQWWTINGQVLMDTIHAAHKGDAPDVLYLGLVANSDGGTGYGDLHDLDDVADEFGVDLDDDPLARVKALADPMGEYHHYAVSLDDGVHFAVLLEDLRAALRETP